MKFYLFTALAVILFAFQAVAQSPVEISFEKGEIVEETVEISINANNFVDLLTFQINVFWDPTKLAIDDIVSSNPALGAVDFLHPANDPNASDPSKFRLFWTDPTAMGTELADGETIATFRFNMVGEECSTTDFTLADVGPQALEQILFANTSLESVEFTVDDFSFQLPGAGCTSAVKEQGEVASVRIYPNPVRDNLQVSFNNHTPNKSEIIIYNDSGEALTETPLTTIESNIDISNINNGVYFYEIRDKGIIVDYGKIMKI